MNHPDRSKRCRRVVPKQEKYFGLIPLQHKKAQEKKSFLDNYRTFRRYKYHKGNGNDGTKNPPRRKSKQLGRNPKIVSQWLSNY